MITFLIPTAKELSNTQSIEKTTLPLAKKTKELIDEMSSFSVDKLQKGYKIKEEAAKTEKQRWELLAQRQSQSFPALLLFNGLMYRHINRDNLSSIERQFLNKHVFITSSLYGIIPALFPIAPHRLDFHNAFKIHDKRLSQLWREDYDHFAAQQDTIVSLLSSEFESVFSPNISAKFIRVKFYEEKEGQLKSHSTISKKGRGDLLTQIITKQIQSLDELKAISFEGYTYSVEKSTPKELIYLKKGN